MIGYFEFMELYVFTMTQKNLAQMNNISSRQFCMIEQVSYTKEKVNGN
jgi:hypothetical protein